MPFRFPLQPVLRLRQSLEQAERLRLLSLSARIMQLRRDHDEMTEARRAICRRMAEALESGMQGAELHLYQGELAIRDRRRAAVAEAIAVLEQQRIQQQQAFLAAQRRRQVIENLRRRHWQVYTRLQERRHQQMLDELFVMRLGYLAKYPSALS
jgi:flagellar export protein FliJ